MRDSVLTVGRSLIFVAFALVLCAGAFLRNGALVQDLRWALPPFP